jgi:hypothetical protein
MVREARVRFETEEADNFTDENTLLDHDQHLSHIRLGTVVTVSDCTHGSERKVEGVENRIEPKTLVADAIKKGVENPEHESDEEYDR